MIESNLIDRGKLQITVRGEDDITPIPNALVRITNPSDGAVIQELETDASGQTQFTELPAPPVEYSIMEMDKRPYALYDVIIKADGFEKLHLGGVQVLPTSKAIQTCRLMRESEQSFNVRNVLLEPNALWGDYPPKLPEADVKELPQATGFVVLPEPVVPEYMIVHLGSPQDSSAKNVWVPFKDYIKKVACSEIYSTWSAETIRANVFAILSFTLNRVYTEWYRGKGYDFTITNTTALDQAFHPEATIFEEISIIVDEIFTSYITKENIRQPLFTQYCDGRRTKCDGLSQWGSQALGQQGMDALSILKRYYGSDIFLTNAKKVEGVPRSYGGTELQKGSTGDDVRIIQEQLNVISDTYSAIPKLKVDSIFGDTMADAVKTFQKIFHLPQSGIVDFSTWYEISNIYVALTKIAQL